MEQHFDARVIQADFDRLALLSTDGWDHNNHYHHFLLKHIPASCRNAFEIGCGTGTFARLLAKRSEQVLALDLSPQMIRIARERSEKFPNIDFHVGDVLTEEFPIEQFDCVVSITTLHHLPMEEILLKMKRSLKANGTLLVLDLFQAEGLSDILIGSVAIPANLALHIIKTGHLRPPREVQAAWEEHGKRDTYLTMSQIRRICADVLPGAQVRRHLLRRYSLVWKKTATL